MPVRLWGVCCWPSPGRKNEDIEIGGNIGSFRTQVGIENGSNRWERKRAVERKLNATRFLFNKTFWMFARYSEIIKLRRLKFSTFTFKLQVIKFCFFHFFEILCLFIIRQTTPNI